MSDLTGKEIRDTYKDLLKVSPVSDNAGVDENVRNVTDGDGTPTSISLSTNKATAKEFEATTAAIGPIPSPYNSTSGQGSDVSISSIEQHSNISINASKFENQKIVHEMSGYIAGKFENKTGLAAIEIMTGDNDPNGTAWFELDIWSTQGKDATNIFHPDTGKGYESAPLVKVVPHGAEMTFGGDGGWKAGIPVVGNWEVAVKWIEGIGYQFTPSSSTLPGITGEYSPFDSVDLLNYRDTVQDNGIEWNFIGQTASITAIMEEDDLGNDPVTYKVESFQINDDVGPSGSTGYIQGFTGYGTGSAVGDPFSDTTFFENNPEYPITIESPALGDGLGYILSINDTPPHWIMTSDTYITIALTNGGSNYERDAIFEVHQYDGAVSIRHRKMKAVIAGGRNGSFGNWRIDIGAPTGAGDTQQAGAGVVSRRSFAWLSPYAGIRNLVNVALSGTEAGEISPASFEDLGEATAYGKHRGIVMSRARYDKDEGSEVVIGGETIFDWWNDPYQLTCKKGIILQDVPYGQTQLGNIIGLNPGHAVANPASTYNTASAQWDQLIGKVIKNDIGASTVEQADETWRVWFDFGDEVKVDQNIKVGSSSDSTSMQSAYNRGFFNTIAGANVDACIIAGKLAILKFPSFGNVNVGGLINVEEAGDIDGSDMDPLYTGTLPGMHFSLTPMIKMLNNMVNVSGYSDVPEDSNEGNFFISLFSDAPTFRVLGVGYSIKLYTSPGYITGIRKTLFNYTG